MARPETSQDNGLGISGGGDSYRQEDVYRFGQEDEHLTKAETPPGVEPEVNQQVGYDPEKIDSEQGACPITNMLGIETEPESIQEDETSPDIDQEDIANSETEPEMMDSELEDEPEGNQNVEQEGDQVIDQGQGDLANVLVDLAEYNWRLQALREMEKNPPTNSSALIGDYDSSDPEEPQYLKVSEPDHFSNLPRQNCMICEENVTPRSWKSHLCTVNHVNNFGAILRLGNYRPGDSRYRPYPNERQCRHIKRNKGQRQKQDDQANLANSQNGTISEEQGNPTSSGNAQDQQSGENQENIQSSSNLENPDSKENVEIAGERESLENVPDEQD